MVSRHSIFRVLDVIILGTGHSLFQLPELLSQASGTELSGGGFGMFECLGGAFAPNGLYVLSPFDALTLAQVGSGVSTP